MTGPSSSVPGRRRIASASLLASFLHIERSRRQSLASRLLQRRPPLRRDGALLRRYALLLRRAIPPFGG